MLEIRPEQMEALDEYALRTFVRRVVGHLRAQYPEDTQGTSDEDLTALVETGIARAEAHGIVAERDVCLYVDVMVVLGPDFDKDPRYPWAGEILNDDSWADTEAKTDALFDAAIEHEERVIELQSGEAR